MEIVIRNPVQDVYRTDGDRLHTVEVREARRTLYVSGTMGLEVDGRPGASLDRQLDLIWSNIDVILGSADMTVDNIVRVTSYLRDASYAEANAAARVAALGGRAVATTAVVVETLVSEWLVEVEVIASA